MEVQDATTETAEAKLRYLSFEYNGLNVYEKCFVPVHLFGMLYIQMGPVELTIVYALAIP